MGITVSNALRAYQFHKLIFRITSVCKFFLWCHVAFRVSCSSPGFFFTYISALSDDGGYAHGWNANSKACA